jgi:hypothetical protein
MEGLASVFAKSSYKAREKSDRKEISFKKKDQITILVTDDGTGWLKGRTKNGQIGWFPRSCLDEVFSKSSLFQLIFML